MAQVKAGLAVAISVALGVATPAWPVAPKGSQAMQMDFSKVTSREKARALVRKGVLVEIRLFPERFGGTDDVENIGYVPPGALVGIESAHDRISGLIRKKAVTRMTVSPDYRGKSIVPVRIVYVAKGNGKGEIELGVDIW